MSAPTRYALGVDEEPGGWYLYRFRTRHHCAFGPSCGLPHPLYIGKSNEPLRRLLEHARDQWWWPLVDGWDVDEQVFATEAEVLAAERAAIESELPLVNKQWNQGNPHRLREPATRPRPAPAGRRGSGRPAARQSRTPQRRSRRVPRRFWLVLGVAAAWWTLTGLVWWAIVNYLPVLAPTDEHPQVAATITTAVGRAPFLAAVAATTLFGWAWIRRRPRKRGWLGWPLLVAAVAAIVLLLRG